MLETQFALYTATYSTGHLKRELGVASKLCFSALTAGVLSMIILQDLCLLFYSVANSSLVPRHLENGEECLVSTICACVDPQFFLRTRKLLLYQSFRTLLSHSSHYIYKRQLCSQSCVVDALSKVRKPGVVLKDKQLMALQHVYSNNDVFVWLMDMASPLLCGLTVCIHALHLPLKGRSSILPSQTRNPWFYMVQLLHCCS